METKEGISVKKVSLGRLQSAVQNGEPLLGVTHIATHKWPHLDEIAALTLISMYGEHVFPGISSGFEMSSVSSYESRKVYGENAWYKFLSEGVLTVCTGGGPLDDHFDKEDNAKKEGSATSRVAHFLGIEKRPEIKHVLRYVDHEDNSGDSASLTGTSGETAKAAQFFLPATSIKATWRVMREEGKEKYHLQKVKHFMEMIRTHIMDQKRLIEETGEILIDMRRVPLNLMTPNLEKGGTPTLVVIRSDSERASTILRINSREDVVAILQIQSNGQFQLFSSIRNGALRIYQLDDVIKALRGEFIRWRNWGRRKEEMIPNNWKETQKEGYYNGTDELYYFRQGGMIFNGSLTQPDVPGLIGDDNRIFPFDENNLIKVVTMALEDQRWPKESQKGCSAGKCPALEGFRCPVYHFGLRRCWENRKGKKA